MSFNLFRVLLVLGIIVFVGGMGYCTKVVFFSGSTSVAQAPTSAPATTPVTRNYPSQTQPPAQPRGNASVNTAQIKAAVDQWLASNPDRQGKTKLVDAMPNQPFKATFVRFPDADAAKWSDNPGQWSQVRIDTNRDGIDDEKWLLKNGRTYKREAIDGSGRTLESQYF